MRRGLFRLLDSGKLWAIFVPTMNSDEMFVGYFKFMGRDMGFDKLVIPIPPQVVPDEPGIVCMLIAKDDCSASRLRRILGKVFPSISRGPLHGIDAINQDILILDLDEGQARRINDWLMVPAQSRN